MKEEIEKLLAHVSELNCKTAKEVEEARVRLLGKKGEITKLFDEFRTYGPELKKEFGRKINELKQLAQDLKARGADISKSGLQRYGAPFERQMARVKMATEQAVALVDAAPDEEDKLSSAVIRITQEKILNLLMELDIDAESVDVNKLFKNAAEIGRASASNKRASREARAAIREEARQELLAEQRARLDALGESGEVDQGTLTKVIQAAYGL